MNASLDLLDFLRAWEGPPHFAPREDPCAPGVWDIGYGHVCQRGAPPITPLDADNLLRSDVARAGAVVSGAVTVPLTQSEYDALVSFTFNVGAKAFRDSTLLRLLNRSQHDAAADQFARWNQAGGKVVFGLTKRRAAERSMFQMADYSGRP